MNREQDKNQLARLSCESICESTKYGQGITNSLKSLLLQIQQKLLTKILT